MKLIAYYIKIGKLLGKFLSSKTEEQDRDELKRWFLNQEVPDGLVEDVLDSKHLERRRELYASVDREEAWQRVLQKRAQRPAWHRLLRQDVLVRTGMAACVALLVWGGIYWSRMRVEQERVMSQIAQIRPIGSKAILYLEDGRAIDLQQDTTGIELQGVDIKANSIEYKETASEQTERFNELVTPRGGEYNLTLVDGTRVWLNAASRRRYFVGNENRERRVYLEGEAYFEVAHDARRPFIVETGGEQIRVLGTRFNVSSYEDAPAVFTTLMEGSVHIVSLTGSDSVLLRPGEQAVYDRSAEDNVFEIREVDAEQYAEWTHGTFVFYRASIYEIMSNLSRWYDFDFEISPLLGRLRFSGQFPRYENLDKVLEILVSTGSGITIDYDGEKIIMK